MVNDIRRMFSSWRLLLFPSVSYTVAETICAGTVYPSLGNCELAAESWPGPTKSTVLAGVPALERAFPSFVTQSEVRFEAE